MPFRGYQAAQFISMQANGNLQFGSRKPKANPVAWILLIMGVIFLVSAFFSERLTVFPIFGIFLILIWSVIYARACRVCLNMLRVEFLAQLRNEVEVKAPLGLVLRLSFFCLLPIYCMWCFPALMFAFGGTVGWLSIGAPFWVISTVAFFSFGAIWKDLYLKTRYYWGMHFLVWLPINIGGMLLYIFQVFL
jgi:hypothetical protein